MLSLVVGALAGAGTGDGTYTYDDALAATTHKVHSCATASAVVHSSWNGGIGGNGAGTVSSQLQLDIKFPDWLEGLEVTVHLCTGIVSLHQCWGVLDAQFTRTPTDARLSFVLGSPPTLAPKERDKAVIGCIVHGIWTAEATFEYEGAQCPPPRPPTPPDLHEWAACPESSSSGSFSSSTLDIDHEFQYLQIRSGQEWHAGDEVRLRATHP